MAKITLEVIAEELQSLHKLLLGEGSPYAKTQMVNSDGGSADIIDGAIHVTKPEKEYFTEIAKGNIAGSSLVHKFGRNDAVPNGSWAFISLTGMTGFGIATPVAARIKSGGNAADTAAGNGARAVIVQGIDSTGAEVTETIVTAGASASSATTKTWWRIHRAWVSAVGTYGVANTGAIIVETTGGVAVITIAAGEGQTQKAVYTIPIDKTGYLLSLTISVDSNKTANVRLMTRENITTVDAPVSSKRIKLHFDGVVNQFQYTTRSASLVLQPLTDIWVEGWGDGAVSQISANFEILLVDN